jgi:hypothetical protein
MSHLRIDLASDTPTLIPKKAPLPPRRGFRFVVRHFGRSPVCDWQVIDANEKLFSAFFMRLQVNPAVSVPQRSPSAGFSFAQMDGRIVDDKKRADPAPIRRRNTARLKTTRVVNPLCNRAAPELRPWILVSGALPLAPFL